MAEHRWRVSTDVRNYGDLFRAHWTGVEKTSRRVSELLISDPPSRHLFPEPSDRCFLPVSYVDELRILIATLA